VRLDTLAAASTALVEAQAEIRLAQVWGGGLLASIDGIRFAVPVRSIHARPSPKFSGRKRGITWLNMLNDQSAGLAAKVLSGTPRDSLNVIDVVQLQRGGKVEHLRAQGYPVLDTDEARLPAFIRGHIGIDGHYAFHLPDLGGSHNCRSRWNVQPEHTVGRREKVWAGRRSGLIISGGPCHTRGGETH
jgi:hypothetical protein